MTTKKMCVSLLATCIVVGGMAATGVASTVVNIPVEADSYVYSDSRWSDRADNNYGSLTELALNNYNWDVVHVFRKTYLRFDLSSLPERSNMELLDAHLILADAGSAPHTCPVYMFGLNDGDPGEVWNEHTITWNNAPGNAAGNDFQANVPYLATANVSFTGVMGNSYSVPLYGGVSMIGQDTNDKVTFVLAREGGDNGAYFLSKEDTQGYTVPTLQIEYNVVPEPGCLSLLVMGGLSVLGLRKRS